MFKVLGGVLIVMSSVFYGIYLVKKADRRVKSLKELENFAIGLLSSLKYSFIPIDDYIFSESKKDNSSEFLKMCAEYNENCTDFHTGWDKAAKICFDNSDEDFVIKFGQKLGTSDLDGQISFIEYYINEIRTRITLAKEKKTKAEKSGVPLLGCLGMGLAILMI